MNWSQKLLKGWTRALPVLDAKGELLGLMTINDINEAYLHCFLFRFEAKS